MTLRVWALACCCNMPNPGRLRLPQLSPRRPLKGRLQLTKLVINSQRRHDSTCCSTSQPRRAPHKQLGENKGARSHLIAWLEYGGRAWGDACCGTSQRRRAPAKAPRLAAHAVRRQPGAERAARRILHDHHVLRAANCSLDGEGSGPAPPGYASTALCRTDLPIVLCNTVVLRHTMACCSLGLFPIFWKLTVTDTLRPGPICTAKAGSAPAGPGPSMSPGT